MTKIQKLLDKMRNNPRDWRIQDVAKVATDFGLVPGRPGGGSSHVTFRHSSGRKITIPSRKPIKPIYIKYLLRLIDDIKK